MGALRDEVRAVIARKEFSFSDKGDAWLSGEEDVVLKVDALTDAVMAVVLPEIDRLEKLVGAMHAAYQVLAR